MTAKATRKEASIPNGLSVLVIEDEPDLQDLLRYNLAREGFVVSSALSGEKGLAMAKSSPPGLILLDLMLPGMDGLEVCRGLKNDAATAGVPILMVSAKSEEADVVSGLELGADDYVTKPFSPRVLLARIRAVLRRRQDRETGKNGGNEPIEFGPISIRPERHEVKVDGENITLTATEFKLLTLLARHTGRVFTRQQIIDTIHGGLAAVTDRSVDVQVVALRRKLGDHGNLIQTIRGVGYRFGD